MTNGVIPQVEVDADIAFFEQKLAAEKDPERQIKIRRQIELLKDAVIIYRTGRDSIDVVR